MTQDNLNIYCDVGLFLALVPEITSFDDTAPYFRLTQSEIEEIRDGTPKARSRKLNMLWKWRSKNGSDATYLSIVNIFIQMRDQRLAELVLNKLRSKEQTQTPPTTGTNTFDYCIYAI